MVYSREVMQDRALKGYLVHVWVHGKQLRLAGRLDNGKSFAAVMPRPERQRFVVDPHGDWQAFDGTRLAAAGGEGTGGITMVASGEGTGGIEGGEGTGAAAGGTAADDAPTGDAGGHSVAGGAAAAGGAAGKGGAGPTTGPDSDLIHTGLGPAEEFLLFRGLRGPVEVRGEWSPGRRVDCVFQNPDIRASEHRGRAVWLSFDIETDRRHHVVAISLSCGTRRTVLFAGPPLDDPEVQSFSSERELLGAFAGTVRAWDPDVLTGWNVADFDFQVLAERFAAQHISFDLGRAEGEQVELRRPASGRVRVTVPGRQVVDAMRIVRGTGRSFTDLSLETVAQEVLGRGKHVSESGDAKLAELDRLRSQDPVAFCRYCLEDSRLVLDILSETALDELTLIRAGLTGMNFELAWTSIPAFERIYGLELIARKVLPPRSSYGGSVTGAAGGTVLEPAPGLFSHVLVFDFRSLYPSVISTFNIDPLNFARTDQKNKVDVFPPPFEGDSSSVDGAGSSAARSGVLSEHMSAAASKAGSPSMASEYANDPDLPWITAPNGACFAREPGILPGLLESYFDARAEALESGDDGAAFVYKILMNSFYGVLGSGNCVYGHRALAGAITGFGRLCLLFARDFFRSRGLQVLYGDTDSVFVYAGGRDLSDEAAEMANELNTALDEHLRTTYGVQSKIRIRLDTAYSRFLLPRLRSRAADAPVRGRAKGYAGLDSRKGTVEVKGMEAARSDYTALAKRFQTELLELLFADADPDRLDGYVRDVVSQLLRGVLDDEIIYHKVLRRAAEDYAESAPPQVRAARAAGWTKKRGRISYVMTVAGPQPLEARRSPLDYRHYIEHQLRPIWDSIVQAADLGDSLAKVDRSSGAHVGEDAGEHAAAAGHAGSGEQPGDRRSAGAHAARARLGALHPFDEQLDLGL